MTSVTAEQNKARGQIRSNACMQLGSEML